MEATGTPVAQQIGSLPIRGSAGLLLPFYSTINLATMPESLCPATAHKTS